MLGAIALTSGRTLDEYIADMKTRGQDGARILEVTSSLKKYSQKLLSGEIKPVVLKYYSENKNTNLNSNNENSTNNISEIDIKSKVSEEEIKEIIESYEKLLLEELDEDSLQYKQNLVQLRKSRGDQLPNEFVCPLTKEIFYDPVMTCDGNSFERKAIELWLEKRDVSPINGEKLSATNLLPNFALKQLIRDYYYSSA
jgi:hypothetical protein